MKICVFGASSAKIDISYIAEVEALGEKMAKRGHSLVYGAGATGVMGAAARGVIRGGGEVHGVIPEFFRDEILEANFYDCSLLT
ncbi:MAG: TIGR00730 family Rossman fold protein, partial [Clostridia bacterium]|nr:TIGR00730 family Rossman fold protein [Clostridia bacterium]